MPRSQITILGNNKYTRQFSMINYGRLVEEILNKNIAWVDYKDGDWRFSEFLSKTGDIKSTGKLPELIDRYLLSSASAMRLNTDVLYVIDPGNVIYAPLIRHKKLIVTVHDMIPYLASAGQLEGFKPSRLGRALMANILRRLKKQTKSSVFQSKLN